jgi:hypothetical protein
MSPLTRCGCALTTAGRAREEFLVLGRLRHAPVIAAFRGSKVGRTCSEPKEEEKKMKLTTTELSVLRSQGAFITERCDLCGKVLNQSWRYTGRWPARSVLLGPLP